MKLTHEKRQLGREIRQIAQDGYNTQWRIHGEYETASIRKWVNLDKILESVKTEHWKGVSAPLKSQASLH